MVTATTTGNGEVEIKATTSSRRGNCDGDRRWGDDELTAWSLRRRSYDDGVGIGDGKGDAEPLMAADDEAIT
ncbi:uncharacterized protein A4U43_C06F13100 [Asparagus officinalis]|uniref:Uncharacterized protein n=1 Tax=Asparagus officinalis TaxID=4686 RepID=A0A5P1ELK1_ASPOF|nr:uncharacterized protein A4U43_C06F13100 [Asparagus officinalis]